MKEVLVGIDPGDRWTGVAKLLINGQRVTVGTYVLDGANRNLVEVVDAVGLPSNMLGHIIAEEYRARPIGHRRFSAPLTPRLLGALEYVSVRNGNVWTTVPAASPDSLQAFPIWDRLMEWRAYWPMPKSERWNHALSAWRVLCAFALRNKPLVHRLIERTRRSPMLFDELPPDLPDEDLIAPFAQWTLLT